MGDKRLTGKILVYLSEKNYGFLQSDATGQEVFFHISGIKDYSVLSSGTRVSFVLSTYLSREIASEIQKLKSDEKTANN